MGADSQTIKDPKARRPTIRRRRTCPPPSFPLGSISDGLPVPDYLIFPKWQAAKTVGAVPCNLVPNNAWRGQLLFLT